MLDPRDFYPESNMPAYPWLMKKKIDEKDIQKRMKVLRLLGDPYTDADIESAPEQVVGKTEMDALVAYLQGLGIDNVPQKSEVSDE